MMTKWLYFPILSMTPIFTARHYATAVYAVNLCLSVRPSVSHKPALYQNG